MLPILNQSFWRDEAFSALLSSFDPLTIIKLTSKDVSPPLYYILLHYWALLFDNSEVTLRTFSLLFHFLGAVVVFFILRKCTKSLWVQLVTPLVVFLNPFLLQYAFEARQYSMLAFLSLCGVYGLLSKRFAVAGLFMGLAIYTHNFGLFTFAAAVLWMLYTYRFTQIRSLLSFALFPIAFLFLWGSVVWSQWTHVAGGFWIKQATTAIFLHSLEVYTRGDLSFDLQPLLYLLSLVLIFFSSAYWIAKKHDESTPISLLAIVAFAPVLITYIISAYFTPIYHERYLIATVPLAITAIAYSLYLLYTSTSHIRVPLLIFLAMYAVVLLQASEKLVSMTTKPALNWGVAQVMREGKDGDIVIAEPINFLELKYYAKQYSKNIHPYTYVPEGEIPFYIGKILFMENDILRTLPANTTVWKLNQDGGYTKLQQPGKPLSSR